MTVKFASCIIQLFCCRFTIGCLLSWPMLCHQFFSYPWTVWSSIPYVKDQNSLISKTEGEGHNEGQGDGRPKSAIKQSEKQIYILLLLVAFSFLTLTTPVYVWLLFINFYQSTTSQYYAANHLFSQVAVKTLYTNYAINFFLYVTSGQKFRTDLKKLFAFVNPTRRGETVDTNYSVQTISTAVSNWLSKRSRLESRSNWWSKKHSDLDSLLRTLSFVLNENFVSNVVLWFCRKCGEEGFGWTTILCDIKTLTMKPRHQTCGLVDSSRVQSVWY